MKTIIKTSRSRKSHLASFSMSKLPRLGKGVVVRAHITKASAAQVVAQVSAQAVTSEITGAANKSYKLVQMPRSKAEKLARRKDGGVFILGASTLPPNKFLRKIEKITPLSNVVGIDKFFPTVGTPVVSVRGTSSHPLAVSKIRTSRGGGAVIVSPSYGGAVFDRDGGGGAYRRSCYVRANTGSHRSKAKKCNANSVVVIMELPEDEAQNLENLPMIGISHASYTVCTPLGNTTIDSTSTESPAPSPTTLTWQQLLTDYAVPDDKCKESYGSHNVRIAMYIKALEDVHLLNIAERQSDKAHAFYQTLSNIFGFQIVQKSVEWQLNHFKENNKNKHTYETEILPLIKSLTKAA